MQASVDAVGALELYEHSPTLVQLAGQSFLPDYIDGSEIAHDGGELRRREPGIDPMNWRSVSWPILPRIVRLIWDNHHISVGRSLASNGCDTIPMQRGDSLQRSPQLVSRSLGIAVANKIGRTPREPNAGRVRRAAEILALTKIDKLP